MDNIEQRLENVFGTVFPDLPAQRIKSAAQDSVENWDSVAAITLMNLIEEEFGVEMDFDDVAELTSFSKIHDYLKGRLSHAAV
jgi:acyl carrier protein